MKVRKLEYEPMNVTQLKEDCLNLLEKYPVKNEMQICLTHRLQVTDPLERIYEGTGKLYSPKDEYDYSIINEDLKGLYIYEILQSIEKGWKLGRTRICVLPPRHCYSMHTDRSVCRFHIAVQTNPYSYVTYPTGEMYHIPADGLMYRMEVDEPHSAFNAGSEDRIHILFEIGDEKHQLVDRHP